jgi:hypothetical protein
MQGVRAMLVDKDMNPQVSNEDAKRRGLFALMNAACTQIDASNMGGWKEQCLVYSHL